MPGEFFDPKKHKKADHTCDLPEIYASTPGGWRCECGKAWIKVQDSQHGESWWSWYRARQHDGVSSD